MKKIRDIFYRILPAGKRGFTLFFAMLVASLSLAVGLAIFDLTLRELDLSATATQSQYAIYAADTGAECALYWDAKYNCQTNGGVTTCSTAFATSSASIPPSLGILCNGIDVAQVGTPPATFVTPQTSGNGWSAWCWNGGACGAASASSATTTFFLTFSPQNYCAKIEVKKSGTAPITTTVTAHGYNTCAVGSALQLERILQITY